MPGSRSTSKRPGRPGKLRNEARARIGTFPRWAGYSWRIPLKPPAAQTARPASPRRHAFQPVRDPAEVQRHTLSPCAAGAPSLRRDTAPAAARTTAHPCESVPSIPARRAYSCRPASLSMNDRTSRSAACCSFGRYLQVPALLRRAGTLRPHWAIPAIRGTEPDRDVRAAVRVGVLLPPYAQPASRTTRPLLPPVDREVLAVLPNDRSTTQRRGSRIHSRFASANNTL